MTPSRLSRHALLGALTFALACSTESVLEVQDPDVINPDQITTAGGAEALRRGALSRFINATSGGESFFLLGGLLADEYRSGDTFTERNETDRRTVQTSNAQVRAAFRLAYRARISAQQSVAVLRQFQADPYKIGEMYLVMAYIENLLAEDACSGAPLSDANGTDVVYSKPKTMTEVLEVALAHADSALREATGTSAEAVRVRNAASVVRGRMLLNLGRHADAAAAVAQVPTAFEWANEHSTTTFQNGVWGLNNAAGRWIVSNGEGGNTINFATAGDPRVPVCRGTGGVTTGAESLPACPAGTATRAFDSGARGIPFFVQQVWPARESPMAIISGVEARLIEAEAALKAGDATKWLATLNALRTRVTGLAPLADPGSATARLDLQFRERAFWLFGRGYRLGDMRRLVRQYGRAAESVFPTGSWFKGGSFGGDLSLPIPQAEENNPEFPAGQACLDRGA